jgi:3-hydroxyacyl-CoA dehydrogenase
MQKIEKVAILGAGIMGSQIAAHFANVGIQTLLYDVTQDLVMKGLQSLEKLKPAALYSPRYIQLIRPCNYQEHSDLLPGVDWIIEGIIEKLEIKKELYSQILPYLGEDTILSSNTSGLLLRDLNADMPDDFQRRFLITHFFNPPRYMHLLEIISGPDTSIEIIQTIKDFAENILGKGIVYAKDTPNFVANRIGVYGMMLTLKLSREMNLTVEEVDKLTGPVLGRPKSASYRTADLVGLDTLAHVSTMAFEAAETKPERDIFQIPEILNKMLRNRWLGTKTNSGFYRKQGREILSLNLNSLEYQPQKKVNFEVLQRTKKEGSIPGKIRTIAYSKEVAGQFCWELLSNILIYAANCVPQITENLVNIDNAMKWGYGWTLGPFETWEALGLEKSLDRMSSEGKSVPVWVMDLYKSGHPSFYRRDKIPMQYYDSGTRQFESHIENPKIIRLNILKNSDKEIRKNLNASLIDLGDGVALTEFHSIIQPSLNILESETLDMISEAIDILPNQGFQALVIGHQGQNFSVGVNLSVALHYANERNWKKLESLTKMFQDLTQKVRFSALPVVAAPFNMCLGGGFELIGACDRRVASAELYCGLVEVGVGLIPGAGGNLRILLNLKRAMSSARPGPFPIVQKAFETIGFAKVSTSAKEALFLGYLNKEDKIVINPEHLIYEAKQEALSLVPNYRPPDYEKEIILPGEAGRLAIEVMIESYLKSGKISGHDALIGKNLAYVLTGGEKASPFQPVDEQYLLDIEREVFVRLCAEPLSQQRMVHTLKTGKPLRN